MDPFSNTNTRNILQHIIRPSFVSDGTGGYNVVTDLINVNNVYISGSVVAGTGGTGGNGGMTVNGTLSVINSVGPYGPVGNQVSGSGLIYFGNNFGLMMSSNSLYIVNTASPTGDWYKVAVGAPNTN